MHCFHCILVEPYKKRKKPKTIAYLLEGFSIKSTQTQSCNCWCCLCWRVDKNHFDLPSRLHFPNQGTILRSGRRKDKKKQWPCCAILKQSKALRDLFLIHVALFFLFTFHSYPLSLTLSPWVPSLPTFRVIFPSGVSSYNSRAFWIPRGGGVVTWLFRA